MRGKIDWINREKANGFIRPDDGSAKIFFNSASLPKEQIRLLAVGHPVEFEVLDSHGGKRAVNMRLLPPGG